MSSLLQIRDEAFSESAAAHDRIRFELAVFKNNAYDFKTGERVGPTIVQVSESLMPQISTGCLRLIPAFREQQSEIHLESDKSDPQEYDQLLVENLDNWDKMFEEVYDEGAEMRSHTWRNLTAGNAISKIKYDPDRRLVAAEGINPTSFAPSPNATKSNFSDCDYSCQQNWQTERHIKRHYPGFEVGRRKAYSFDKSQWKNYTTSEHKIDEIWMRRHVAEDVGVNINGTNRRLIVAKIINDKLYRCSGSPYWYPDFPYAHWRNFLDLKADGSDHDFWGYGYGTLCWPQQKMIDEFLSNFIIMLRNLGVGRYIAEDGAIDEDFFTQHHGAIMKLNEGFKLDTLEQIAPEQIPPEFIAFVEFITNVMVEMMPSLSQVFAGEQPNANQSGKAIQSLQIANFNQLSDNIREMNQFRLRRKRIKLALTQQFARRPIEPYLWRGGLDIQDPFPEEARHIGFKTTMPDLTSLPNTPAGRIELLERMLTLGYMPKNPFELLGITKGYGWTPEDFVKIPLVPGQGQGQMHTGAMNGTEPAMRAER